jgi:hypothetical protein
VIQRAARVEGDLIVNVAQVKQTAQSWIDANRERWPGLRAAHLVGGITTLPDDTPFPADKDVDLHLIFADGDPTLNGGNPWLSLIEESYGGIMIEAGRKSTALYASAETVLGNPEIAHHLTVDSILYDPDDLLGDLQGTVRRDYRRRRWVCARLGHERRGLAEAFDLLSMARSMWGASGEVNLLGYTTTFATAALAVASLDPPRMGSRTVLRLREALTRHGRLDLYEALLATIGLATISPAEVEDYLREAMAGFDLVVTIREQSKSPEAILGPFQHKLHRHLRPYFVGACRSMLDEGHHREAMGWVLPYHLATADVILAHGPAAVVPEFAARQAKLLQTLGLDTSDARAAAIVRATQIYDELFTLAEAIIAGHPEIID